MCVNFQKQNCNWNKKFHLQITCNIWISDPAVKVDGTFIRCTATIRTSNLLSRNTGLGHCMSIGQDVKQKLPARCDVNKSMNKMIDQVFETDFNSIYVYFSSSGSASEGIVHTLETRLLYVTAIQNGVYP